MRAFLALVALVAQSQASNIANSKVLTLRGGMDLGPVTADNVGGVLKVAAALTASGAILEKYAGVGETTITKAAKGDFFSTNLVIAMVTYLASRTPAHRVLPKCTDARARTTQRPHSALTVHSRIARRQVTGVATNVLYSVGSSDFDAGKLTSALWLISVLVKFKDAGFDVGSLMNDPMEMAVAVVSTLLAWA